MKIVSRKQAIQEGLKTYFTGQECSKGHKSERRTSDYHCIKCIKEKKKNEKEIQLHRIYVKKWGKKNPEKKNESVIKARKKRVETKGKYLELNPCCKKCGCKIRYASSLRCIKCTTSANFRNKF